MKKYKQKTFKILLGLFLLFAVSGIFDSIYLTLTYYTNTALTCGILDGCNIVAQSEYSSIFGIRLSVFGIFYYTLLTLFAIILFFVYVRRILLQFLIVLTSIGFISSIYFTYLQLFVINAVCIYCLWSAFSSTLLFILSIILINRSIMFEIHTNTN